MGPAWVLVLGIALAACGTRGGPREAELPEPPDPQRYRAEVPLAQAWRAEAGGLPNSPGYGLVAAVAADTVYVAGAGGQVRALDRSSGKLRWEVDLERPLSAGPVVGNGLLVLGTRDGKVLGLSPEDGAVRWISGVTSEVLAQPRVSDRLVVARSIDGRVFGLSPQDGRRLWLFDQTPPLLTVRGISSPVLIPGRLVVVGLDTGKLVGLDVESGKLLWETTVATPQGRYDIERMVDIDADPVLFRSDIYAVSYQGKLVAVDAASGRTRWEREVSSLSGLTVDASRVYLVDVDQRLWAFDRFSGASVWRQEALRGLRLTAPAVLNDFLVVGDDQGYLNWLSPRDGELLRRERIGGAFVAAPRVVDGELYLLTTEGLTVLR